MTYSIVARDPESGQIGVAVQTALIGVGSLCPWARAGVGAVATQSYVRVSHGPSGLQLLGNGHTAAEALAAVLAGDAGREVRQIGMVDAAGRAASHTGSRCIRFAGHEVGDGFSVQANMMLHDTVPGAMAAAYEESDGLALVDRLLAALAAAQQAGGDFRGQQSAALKIVDGTLRPNLWDGVLFDVRVDDDAAPVARLAAICERLKKRFAYGTVYQLIAEDKFDEAIARFRELHGQPSENGFNLLLELALRHDRLDPIAVELQAYLQQPQWQEYYRRMADARYRQEEHARTQVEGLMAAA